MKFAKLILAVSLALGAVACTHNVPIPGAVNQFDSDTYLTLITAKAAIDQTKTELANNAFPANVADKVKQAVNTAVTTYNTANVTYQAFHAAALSGQDTPAQQAAVNNAVNNLNSAVNGITSAKAGN